VALSRRRLLKYYTDVEIIPHFCVSPELLFLTKLTAAEKGRGGEGGGRGGRGGEGRRKRDGETRPFAFSRLPFRVGRISRIRYATLCSLLDLVLPRAIRRSLVWRMRSREYEMEAQIKLL
jgi:hypothetical protein